MTRPIYFRGQSVNERKNFVFGYYMKRGDKEYIFDGASPWRVTNVAQFVGHDANLNSVYEGDILVDELELEHVAEIYDRPNVIASLTLKK